jgi:uncharacterized protein
MSEFEIEPSSSVRPGERVVTLDIIRGFALFGILVMNMPAFGASFYAGWSGIDLWPGDWNRLALHVRDVLFDGKFNSMFSFLFAIGFTIQLERLERHGTVHALAIYTRRLLALFTFGIAHAILLWSGDVLHMYALLGFVLLFMRRWPDRAVIGVIVLCFAYPAMVGLLRMHWHWNPDIGALIDFAKTREASNDLAYGSGSYGDVVIENAHELYYLYTSELVRGQVASFYVMMLATTLLGLLAGRHRLIQRAAEFRNVLPALQLSMFAVGIVAGVFFTLAVDMTSPFDPSLLGMIVAVSYAVARAGMMLFYVLTLVRLSLDRGPGSRLGWLAYAGRMPLSNYLLQSVIGTIIFYGWGLGFWGKVPPVAQVGLAFVIFACVQIPLSRWWLGRFAYGPMEYLWRTLTYGRAPQR